MESKALRLLAPGGLVLHQDVAIQNRQRNPFELAERAYDVYFNDEPFWEDFADADVAAELATVGFDAQRLGEFALEKIEGPGHWFAVYAEKAETRKENTP